MRCGASSLPGPPGVEGRGHTLEDYGVFHKSDRHVWGHRLLLCSHGSLTPHTRVPPSPVGLSASRPPPRLTSGSGVREDSSPEAPLVGILAWKCLGPRTFREPDSEAVVPDPARLLCSPRVASQAPGRPCLAAPGPGSVPSSLSALHAQATD